MVFRENHARIKVKRERDEERREQRAFLCKILKQCILTWPSTTHPLARLLNLTVYKVKLHLIKFLSIVCRVSGHISNMRVILFGQTSPSSSSMRFESQRCNNCQLHIEYFICKYFVITFQIGDFYQR